MNIQVIGSDGRHASLSPLGWMRQVTKGRVVLFAANLNDTNFDTLTRPM